MISPCSLQFALPCTTPEPERGHTVIFMLKSQKETEVKTGAMHSPCAYNQKKKLPQCFSAKFQNALHLQLSHAVPKSRNAVSLLSADSLGVGQTLAHLEDAIHDDGVDAFLRLQLAVVDVVV